MQTKVQIEFIRWDEFITGGYIGYLDIKKKLSFLRRNSKFRYTTYCYLTIFLDSYQNLIGHYNIILSIRLKANLGRCLYNYVSSDKLNIVLLKVICTSAT